MSARLIKGGQGTAEAFSRYTIPSGAVGVSAASPRPGNNSAAHPEQAQVEANEIIARAQARAIEIEHEARENARQLIATEVQTEVARTVTPWQEQLSETLEELDGLRVSITTRAERELVRLAIEIAKKVVHREVTIDSEVVMTLARIGISRMHNRVAASIHLNPEDFVYVTAHRSSLEAGHVLELVEDRSIGRGGCLLQTEMGDIDTRIEQQFAEIERAFLG